MTLEYKETCMTLKKLVQKTRIDYKNRIIEESKKNPTLISQRSTTRRRISTRYVLLKMTKRKWCLTSMNLLLEKVRGLL